MYSLYRLRIDLRIDPVGVRRTVRVYFVSRSPTRRFRSSGPCRGHWRLQMVSEILEKKAPLMGHDLPPGTPCLPDRGAGHVANASNPGPGAPVVRPGHPSPSPNEATTCYDRSGRDTGVNRSGTGSLAFWTLLHFSSCRTLRKYIEQI